jgi:outer membrane protein assembly factor BamB
MFVSARRGVLAGALIAVGILASACATGPTETTWGSLGIVQNQPQHIFFSFSERLVMLDPIDGSPVELRDEAGNVRLDDQGNPRVWEVLAPTNAAHRFYTQPITLDEDTVLVMSYERAMYEVDLPTARIENPTGYAISDRVVAESLMTDDLLYVPYAEGNVGALSTNGFGEVWRSRTNQGVWSEPLLIDNSLVVSSLDHFLYALDPITGEEQWRLDVGGALASEPLLYENALYVGSFQRKILKISLDGQILAEFDTRDWVWGTPTIVDNVLYAGDVSGYLYALELGETSFTPVWEPRQVATRAIVATPLIVNDQIVVGSRDAHIYWIDRDTGAELIKRQMAGEVLGNFLLLEPSEALPLQEPIILATTMARSELVVAFTIDNGERLWVYSR